MRAQVRLNRRGFIGSYVPIGWQYPASTTDATVTLDINSELVHCGGLRPPDRQARRGATEFDAMQERMIQLDVFGDLSLWVSAGYEQCRHPFVVERYSTEQLEFLSLRDRTTIRSGGRTFASSSRDRTHRTGTPQCVLFTAALMFVPHVGVVRGIRGATTDWPRCPSILGTRLRIRITLSLSSFPSRSIGYGQHCLLPRRLRRR